MAQVNSKQTDLQRALLRVRVPAMGTKVFPALIAGEIYNECFGDFDLPFLNHMLPEFEQIFQTEYEEQLRSLFDDQPPFQFKEMLLTGSFREGLFIYEPEVKNKPDFDFMCCIKNISFSQEDQACGGLDVKEETPFVNAYITNPEVLAMWKDFLEEPTENREGQRLSASKLKSKLFSNYRRISKRYYPFLRWEKSEPIGDGPSLDVRNGYCSVFDDIDQDDVLGSLMINLIKQVFGFGNHCDIVLAIPCEGWPLSSLEWIYREKCWPSKELIQKIVRQGFHLVPKSSTNGDFRLSFTQAEITLIENAKPIQHKVLRAFKAIIKHHQNEWSPDIKDLICTYHLKTIAFWRMERFPQDSWTEDNVVSHLFSLLEEFAEAVRNRYLPMYFLPRYNLLKDVGTPEKMRNISDKVMELTRDITRITTIVEKLERLHFMPFMLIADELRKRFPGVKFMKTFSIITD